MPSFSPFRFLGTFPHPPTNTSANYFGPQSPFDNKQILASSSIITEEVVSVPFWWLFYKLSFSGTATIEFPVLGENYEFNFLVEFINEEDPNDKICRENLPINGNGNFIVAPETETGLFLPNFYIQPFQCDNLHCCFYVYGDVIARGVSWFWYISSGPAVTEELSTFSADNFINIYSDQFTLQMPNSQSLTLNSYVDVAGLPEGEGSYTNLTGSLSFDEVEWYTL
jgi:hypothetical protein